jgi:uncharacterized protein
MLDIIELDPQVLLLAALACFTGAYVQTAIGFGMAIIAAPLMFYLDPALVPGPLSFVILMMCLINGWRFRKGLELNLLAPALLARIPGSLVGVWLLGVMSQSWLAILIAFTIMLGVLVRLCNLALPTNGATLSLGGFLSGVMGTSTTIGGPPMVLVLHGADMHRIRANLAGFFLVSSLMSVIALIGGGYGPVAAGRSPGAGGPARQLAGGADAAPGVQAGDALRLARALHPGGYRHVNQYLVIIP